MTHSEKRDCWAILSRLIFWYGLLVLYVQNIAVKVRCQNNIMTHRLSYKCNNIIGRLPTSKNKIFEKCALFV